MQQLSSFSTPIVLVLIGLVVVYGLGRKFGFFGRGEATCGVDYDHNYGPGEDLESGNDLTYVCQNPDCGHVEKAPIGRPPALRT